MAASKLRALAPITRRNPPRGGIADQDIEPAERFLHVLDHLGDVVLLADVGLDGDGPAAVTLNGGDGLLRLVRRS